MSATAGDGVNGYDNCSLTWQDVSDAFFNNWTSANHSIATVDSYGTHTGVGVGSTSSATTGYVQSNHQPLCPNAYQAPGAGVNVGPYRVEPISTTTQGAAMCPSGQHGWSRTVQNQLQYVNGAGYRVSGITMTDLISIGSTNQLAVGGSQTGSYPTDGNGSWPDTYFVCSPACPSSGETDALQTWKFNQIPLAHSDSLVYKCSSITIDGL